MYVHRVINDDDDGDDNVDNDNVDDESYLTEMSRSEPLSVYVATTVGLLSVGMVCIKLPNLLLNRNIEFL